MSETEPRTVGSKIRVLVFVVGVAFLVQLLRTGYLHAASWDLRDFGSGFITAERVLARGWDGLYDLQDQVAEQQAFYDHLGVPPRPGTALPFIYAPVTVFIFMPLVPIQPPPLAYALWMCLNLALAILAVALILGIFKAASPPSPTLPRKGGGSPTVPSPPVGERVRVRGHVFATVGLSTLIVVGFAPLAFGILIGQSVGFTVLLYTLAFLAFWRGSDRAGACCLALTMMIKPQLVVGALLLLVVQRRWQALATFLAASAGLGLISLALVGTDGVRDYLATIRQMDNFFGTPEYGMSTAAMVNWRSLVARVPGMTESIGSAAVGALAVATLGLAAWVWRRPGLHGEPFVRGFLAFTAAGLLSGYHDHYQDLGTLIPPALVLLLLYLGRRPEGRASGTVPGPPFRAARSQIGAGPVALTLAAVILLVVIPSTAWLLLGPSALVRAGLLAPLAAPALICITAAASSSAARP